MRAARTVFPGWGDVVVAVPDEAEAENVPEEVLVVLSSFDGQRGTRIAVSGGNKKGRFCQETKEKIDSRRVGP
jgi:hypothetical protein